MDVGTARIGQVLRRPVSPAALLVAITAAIAAATFLLVSGVHAGRGRPQIFDYLFRRNEPAAAWASCAIILLAAVAARLFPALGESRLVSRLAADARPFAAAMTIAMAAAALLVYRAHPLAMDEYAPIFQAGAFARFSLTGKVPAELVWRIAPRAPFWFLQARTTGEMISTYWPGFALLLTPFMWLRAPWLLNPLIGGATLLMIGRLARRFWPDGPAAGWAVLLTAASPAFVINCISYYSMPAHLLSSLCFAELMLAERYVAAGAVGSVALVLNNPFPHAIFALPWLASVALREGRLRNLARLAAGYLPLSLLLGVGWFVFRAGFQQPVPGSPQGLPALLETLGKIAFSLPSGRGLWDRSVNLSELAMWAVPALLPLAALGGWIRRRETGPRLIALSALCVFAGYFFVPFSQGHGWGFRYFHVAWGVLPLLAAGALVAPAPEWRGLRPLMLVAAIASLFAGNLLRCVQVRTFIDGHLAQIPPAGGDAKLEVVMVHVRSGYYSIDLVQNDPFLEGSRWMLISSGPADDQSFMRNAFPHARLAAANEIASVWKVE